MTLDPWPVDLRAETHTCTEATAYRAAGCHTAREKHWQKRPLTREQVVLLVRKLEIHNLEHLIEHKIWKKKNKSSLYKIFLRIVFEFQLKPSGKWQSCQLLEVLEDWMCSRSLAVWFECESSSSEHTCWSLLPLSGSNALCPTTSTGFASNVLLLFFPPSHFFSPFSLNHSFCHSNVFMSFPIFTLLPLLLIYSYKIFFCRCYFWRERSGNINVNTIFEQEGLMCCSVLPEHSN